MYMQTLVVKNSEKKKQRRMEKITQRIQVRNTCVFSQAVKDRYHLNQKKFRKNVFSTGKWETMGAKQICFQ